MVEKKMVTLRITAGEPKKRKIWHSPMVLNGFLRLVCVFSADKNMRRHDSITGWARNSGSNMSNFSSILDFGELLVDTVQSTVRPGTLQKAVITFLIVTNRFLPSSPAKHAKAGLAPRVILVVYSHKQRRDNFLMRFRQTFTFPIFWIFKINFQSVLSAKNDQKRYEMHSKLYYNRLNS